MHPVSFDSRPKAVVAGGGATGCGVARDLVLRGFDVTLVEFDDLGSGTSSRFHGMLQSGARYAVSDTEYAGECMRERRIVAALVPEAVEPVGGLFVALEEDPADFSDAFVRGCGEAMIPVEVLDPADVLAREPALSRRLARAFAVPDATINPWRLVNRLAEDIRSRGGRILTRTSVRAVDVGGGRVRTVSVEGAEGARELPADIFVNAGGPWAGRLAELVGVSVDLQLTKGAIIVLAHRVVSHVVNRCRPPTSHDIMAPAGTVALFGTTSETVEDPDDTQVRPADIQALLDGAESMVPGIRAQRCLRAWAGVRPLVRPRDWPQDRPLPRRHMVVDHAAEGIGGFFSVCGGSLTTHRSMAEDLGDRVCAHLGLNRPCLTHETPLRNSTTGATWRPAAGLAKLEAGGDRAALLCECEMVEAESVLELAGSGVSSLQDMRRRLRIGFGPCQGAFCAVRAAALIGEHVAGFESEGELAGFRAERLKGMARTGWGEQARQILLGDVIYGESLGLDRGADAEPPAERR